MNIHLRLLAMVLPWLAACSTLSVEPPPATEFPLHPARPPALRFELVVDRVLPRRLFDTGSRDPSELAGKPLARAARNFADYLRNTGAFAAVASDAEAPADAQLSCNLRLHQRASGLSADGLLLTMSCGLIPEFATFDHELEACVSAPGRAPRTYRAVCSEQGCVWLPGLPVALVQVLTRRSPMQQTVDAVVAQIAADGWLDG